MTELAKYEAAERALAEADAVDEVLEIRSQASAWEAYAKQARNPELQIKASRIRFRAERRLGEMLLASDLAKGGRPFKEITASDSVEVIDRPPTLKDVGIDHKLSARVQRVASMDRAEFEQALVQHAEEMRSGRGRVAMDLLKIGAEERGRQHRRDLARVLSDASVELPTGRQFPAAYIDCPWQRKAGIGNRAYENHYPTMTWPEILEFLRQARDVLLPDSWAFFWIPRAHLLATVETELEATVSATGEVVLARVDVPLAWACQLALGMDSYSTCFVWTKTDEDVPDDRGLGLIAWDQDELLLLFKRGQGLPKPSGAEKFGSNHRERPREHSRKPDFYRHMIATMTGGLPVLEMFARVDDEHPLPEGWEACGNQSQVSPTSTVESETKLVDAMADAIAADEFTVLRAVSDFCFPDRAALLARSAGDAIAGGLVVHVSHRNDWALTEAGRALLLALEDEHKRTEREPPPAADHPALQDANPETGKVSQQVEFFAETADAAVPSAERPGSNSVETFKQVLSDDEFIEWQGLARIRDGVMIEAELARGLIGCGYVAVLLGEKLVLTESGQKWLRSIERFVERSARLNGGTIGVEIERIARQIDLEQVIPPAPAALPLDLPLFLASRENVA